MKVGVALLDLLAGLECAVGALAALVGRGRVGASRSAWWRRASASLDQRARQPPRHGSRAGAPRQCPPEHRAVPGVSARRWRPGGRGRQRRAIPAPAQRARPGATRRFATNAQRVEPLGAHGPPPGRDRGPDRDELLDALAVADVPAGPVHGGRRGGGHGARPSRRLGRGPSVPPPPIRVDGELRRSAARRPGWASTRPREAGATSPRRGRVTPAARAILRDVQEPPDDDHRARGDRGAASDACSRHDDDRGGDAATATIECEARPG